MAKRRKEGAGAEEPLDFQIPKFDEKAFIRRERRNIKTLFLAFLFGLLISLLCFGFWALLEGSFLRWELVLLVGVVNSIWIKYLFLKLKIDLTDFGRKGWLSAYAVYFLTWLLVLTVLVNPPFYDTEAPRVDVAVLPGMQEPGGTILIVASIVDNVGVSKEGISFTIIDPLGTTHTPLFTYENTIFRYTYENPSNLLGTYNYTLIASDANSKKTTKTGSFIYSNGTLQIISSQRTGLTSGDTILIQADQLISPVNFRVFYRIENGSEINVNRKDATDKQKYETTPEFEGWNPNENITVTLFAEARYYFVNNPEKFSNIVRDTTNYQFSTANDLNIGSEEPLVEYNITLALQRKEQLPNTLNYVTPYPVSIGATPGFEIVVFMIAIIAAVFLFKRKKKDNKT